MEHLNYWLDQLPPLSHRLRSDKINYNKFINNNDLRSTFTIEFIESFFWFLDIIAEQEDIKQQYLLLEDPMGAWYKPEFWLYMTIFERFLQIYGENIQCSTAQSWFEKYSDIVLQSEIKYIKQTQKEIAEILDPPAIYNLYQIRLIECLTTFEEQLDFIGSIIGYDKKLLGESKSLSIIDILGIYKYEQWEQAINNHESWINQQLIKPFLIQNSYICKEYIQQMDQKELEKEFEKDDNIKKYETIINHLNKKPQPIQLDIDQTQSFSRPICTQDDFEECYNDFTLLAGRYWNEPIYIYPKKYRSKVKPINAIKDVKFEREGKSVSIRDYISNLLIKYNQEEEYEEEYEEKVSEYKEKCNIINNITNNLTRYFKMNIYLGIDNNEALPTISIRVDEYINQHDSTWNHFTTEKKPKSIIIKPTFCISSFDRSHEKYMIDFINFIEALSPDYDCLKMLWITEKNL